MLSILSCHTVLYCQKWKECISFYQDVLGFPIVFANNILVEVEPKVNTRIGLIDVSRTKRKFTAPENIILSFQVASIEKAYACLKERYRGILEIKSHPWGAKLIELKDPEGRIIEFWEKED